MTTRVTSKRGALKMEKFSLFSTSRQNFSLIIEPASLKQSSWLFTMLLKFKELLELQCISGRNNRFYLFGI